MKPKKLVYNEQTDTFTVYGEGEEGSTRSILSTATEEWVIEAILKQHIIDQNVEKYQDSFSKVENDLQDIKSVIKSMLNTQNEIKETIKELQKPKKSFFSKFKKNKNGI